MAGRVGPQTALIVGSAPCYPFGVIDPIPALGRLAGEAGTLLHVDACLARAREQGTDSGRSGDVAGGAVRAGIIGGAVGAVSGSFFANQKRTAASW